jgi:PKD repeat protein
MRSTARKRNQYQHLFGHLISLMGFVAIAIIFLAPLSVAATPLGVHVVAPNNSLTIPFTGIVTGGKSPYTYNWNFGDGTTSTVQNPNHTYPDAGHYTATFTVTDSASGTATASQVITVAIPFDFSLANNGNLSIVQGTSATNVITATLVSGTAQPVSFSIAGLPSGATASFSPTTCSLSCTTTLSITAAPSAPPGIYTPIVTGTSGTATRTTSFNLTVVTPLSVSATASPVSGYIPLAAAFTSSPSGGIPPYTYNWDFGDGTTSTSVTPNHTYRTAGHYTAILTVTDSASATASASQTIAAADFSLADNGNLSIVQGTTATNTITAALVSGTAQPVSFSVDGLPTGVTASFSRGSCSPSCTTTLTITVASSTSPGTYTLVVTGASGTATRTTSFKLTVVAPLSVSTTASPTSGYTPLAVAFASSPSGGIPPYSYNWDFGDGTTGTSNSPNHTYKTAGSYTAALTVTDSASATASASQTIAVAAPFDFSLTNSGNLFVKQAATITNTITASLVSGTSQPVSFSAAGLPTGATASFSPGSCSPSRATALSITTASSTPAGTYTITVTGVGGNATHTTSFNLAVAPTPAMPNKGAFYMIPSGGMTVPSPFPDHTQGVFYSVQWAALEPGNGVFNWTPITTVESALPAGKYMQLVILTGETGSPASTAVCTLYQGHAIPGCTPWLATAGMKGIVTHSDLGPNGATHGYPLCTPLVEPYPADPVYIGALENFISHFEAQFSGDSKIALVILSPMSHEGSNLSLGSFNNDCDSSGNPGSEYYNAAWNAISGCAGNESCWNDAITSAGETLWNYEVTTMPDQNLALWVNPSPFPDISTPTSLDVSSRNAIFNYAAAHKPARGTYHVANEALQQSNSWASAVTPFSADGYGAQMARSFATDCAGLQDAGVNYGAAYGVGWVQIYKPDFAACPSAIAAISAALGGM